MATLKNISTSDTDYLTMPKGTFAQRPGSPSAGMIRYNTDVDQTEYYDGTVWRDLTTGKEIIVNDSLEMNLDCGDTDSFPGGDMSVAGDYWYDLTDNARHAQIYGTNKYTDTDGGKMDYPSGTTADYISLDNTAFTATGANYTIELWLKPAGSGTRYFMSLSDGSNHNYNIYQDTGSALSRYTGTGSISYTANNIIQLVAVRSGSDTGTWYKNGSGTSSSMTAMTTISSAAAGGCILNQEQDALGGSFDANQNFLGGFLQMRVYSKALSTAEIDINWNAMRHRYGL